jgi:hypothetical protein
MKIIYDSDQPEDKRLVFIGKDGKEYFGFHVFQLKLYDGEEEATIGNWRGTLKERNQIIKRFKEEG